MKRFVKKVITYLFLITLSMLMLISFDFFVVGNQYLYGYDASILDKVNRLESIHEPKIILVGNSNVAFGFNSALLEEAFDMPVVNLGIHGSLGNAFHENLAKFNIDKGDIVVVCHSDYGDVDDIGDGELFWITLEKHKELYSLIRLKDYKEWTIAYPKYLFKAFYLWATKSGNRAIESVYSRSAFNKYGDIENRTWWERAGIPVTEGSSVVPTISDECITRLNQFNDYVNNKGATMVIAGFPIADGEYTPPLNEYEQFQNELESRVNCDVISNFTDYLIPYSNFYDTAYHLDEEGAIIRTKLLISDLKKWMNNRPSKS